MKHVKIMLPPVMLLYYDYEIIKDVFMCRQYSNVSS